MTLLTILVIGLFGAGLSTLKAATNERHEAAN
jgi:hypothetical protein